MKKALICLEQLGIGGVETFTITQIEEFTRRNIKCYVMARDGILKEQIENKSNIEYIEFDFKLENTLDYSKISEIEKFVIKNKIDFIYVHQFPCVPYILPVVFKTKVPYVAYLHNIVLNTCEWFMNTYPIYRILLPTYFECASKIIAISETVKEENKKLFNLPERKYITIKNSLDFNNYPNKKIKSINCNYKTMLWFGRITQLKRQSIETAIEFYDYCKENYNKDMKLIIVGDGELFDEMVEKAKNKNIIFKGALSNMKSEIEKADILLGVDRCALESIASKKPTIICGYDKNIVLITPKNIKKAAAENFTGRNLKNDKSEIFKYNQKEIIDIIEKNYDYVSENLSISKSIYLDIDNFENSVNMNNIFFEINEYQKKIASLEKKNKELFLEGQELYKIIDSYKTRNNIINRMITKTSNFYRNLLNTIKNIGGK